jgi:hypothetical protein
LREEGRLRVSENRVLRRIFGPKKEEVTTEWRQLHNEGLKSVLVTQYCSGDKIENKMGRAWSANGGEERRMQGFWWGKPERKRSLGRPRRRWEDNIKSTFRKWVVGVWTGLIWLRIWTGCGHL